MKRFREIINNDEMEIGGKGIQDNNCVTWVTNFASHRCVLLMERNTSRFRFQPGLQFQEKVAKKTRIIGFRSASSKLPSQPHGDVAPKSLSLGGPFQVPNGLFVHS